MESARSTLRVRPQTAEGGYTLAAKTVLVVDDDRSTVELLREMLSDMGYASRVAKDCEEAMRYLGSTKIDLVVTDVVMPGMWGSQLALWCKAMHPDLPVVLISGDLQAIAQLMEAGTLALTKPVTRAALERVLSSSCNPMPVVARVANHNASSIGDAISPSSHRFGCI